eukprot:scaffold1600_cov179-Amphora_coffeaeformis.AAC.11
MMITRRRSRIIGNSVLTALLVVMFVRHVAVLDALLKQVLYLVKKAQQRQQQQQAPATRWRDIFWIVTRSTRRVALFIRSIFGNDPPLESKTIVGYPRIIYDLHMLGR